MKELIFHIIIFIYSMTLSQAQNIVYQKPPQPIVDLIEAPQTPTVSLSPDKTNLLFLNRPSLPGIDEVAAEELRIGGLRINPSTNGSSRSSHYVGMTLAAVSRKTETPIQGLPVDPKIENVLWAPNGQSVAFTHTTEIGLELWIADIASASAQRFNNILINDAISGMPYIWFSDGQHLLIKKIPDNRGPKPIKATTPTGPVIQENSQAAAPVRTYQDLLKSPHDEVLFEYFTRSSLAVFNIVTRREKELGIKGIVTEISTSPDGQYLMIEQLKRPFSYMVPYYRFAHEVTIFDQSGRQIRRVADQPAAESIPKGFNAVPTGPRNFGWRSDKPATIYWVEAQDEGDPKKEVELRDRLFLLEAPFLNDPIPSISFALRFRGITWGDDSLAIAHEFWWSSRREITSSWAPGHPTLPKKIIFDRSYEDRYTDPGDFQTELNLEGRSILARDDQGELFLTGIGASPEGNRSFVDLFNPTLGTSQRLWRSEAPYYEIPLAIVDKEHGVVITRRESEKTPPNYFLRNLNSNEITQITHFDNPYKLLEGVSKELIRYTRNDGVELTGTLYLPSDYNREEDGPLPVLMWAYPREYKSKDAASQVRNSPYEFVRISYGAPLFWVLRGYAIFDNFAMPIIGEGDEEPNETFVPQLVSGAEAAIDKIVAMGIADRGRIGVGGHSYGAFMTANLLAHSDLFAAGIARSGAYNRTLTPFGFQSEERTYWEAPHIYHTMSPFMHADKIKEPILLIHGQADNNSGTYPMQSERFYAALKGHGVTSRLVMLPHESHGYRARESIMHMLWEMDQWLEKYVKKAALKEVKQSTP